MNKTVLIPIFVMLFSACSGQVKEVSCVVNDWDMLGQKIAKSGESVRAFELYKQQCGSAVGEAEKEAYLDGFTKGIIEYCTFDNGYELGSNSRPMTNTCPPELVHFFAKGYKVGQLEHEDKLNNLKKYSDLSETRSSLTESSQVKNRPPR